jgi:hypothetical protein
VASWLAPNAEINRDKDRISAVVDSFTPDGLYWSRLERPFRDLLIAMAADGADVTTCFCGWYWQTLDRAAKNAFDQSIGRIDAGRDLKAVNAGRRQLLSLLSKIRIDNRIQYREKEGVA